MATLEERLATLEKAAAASQKSQQDTSDHIRETNENTTILLGVIRSQGRDIKRITEQLDSIDTRLNSLETQITEQKDLLKEILSRLPENS